MVILPSFWWSSNINFIFLASNYFPLWPRNDTPPPLYYSSIVDSMSVAIGVRLSFLWKLEGKGDLLHTLFPFQTFFCSSSRSLNGLSTKLLPPSSLFITHHLLTSMSVGYDCSFLWKIWTRKGKGDLVTHLSLSTFFFCSSSPISFDALNTKWLPPPSSLLLLTLARQVGNWYTIVHFYEKLDLVKGKGDPVHTFPFQHFFLFHTSSSRSLWHLEETSFFPPPVCDDKVSSGQTFCQIWKKYILSFPHSLYLSLLHII